tara:strand:+ start:4589 stop:4855 length:267 start_codon:yes stop_codon:yes gene_type:complete
MYFEDNKSESLIGAAYSIEQALERGVNYVDDKEFDPDITAIIRGGEEDDYCAKFQCPNAGAIQIYQYDIDVSLLEPVICGRVGGNYAV